MHTSKLGYYGDFVVYPITIIALFVIGYEQGESARALALTWLVGFGGWTLMEYVVHRFIFHVVPVASRMHGDHHDDPLATIGTPCWLSWAGYMVLFLLPVWWALGLGTSATFLSGLLTGYLWYLTVHHGVHHWKIDDKSWLYTAKQRHLSHHFRVEDGNYGVTTGFWDVIFGTKPRPTARRQRSA